MFKHGLNCATRKWLQIMGTLRAKFIKCNWKMSQGLKSATFYAVILVLSLYWDSGSAHLVLSKQCGDVTCEGKNLQIKLM